MITGIRQVKSQGGVAEAVHLLDEQYLEDLIGSHHTVTIGIGITESTDEVLVNQIDNFDADGLTAEGNWSLDGDMLYLSVARAVQEDGGTADLVGERAESYTKTGR